jgi:hypothetical protein
VILLTVLKSSYSPLELIARWVDRLNPRVLPETTICLDLVSAASEKGIKSDLCAVQRFERAVIVDFQRENRRHCTGSEIRGFFTKGVLAYIFVGMLLAIIFFIYQEVKHRYTDISWLNIALLIIFILELLSLLRTPKGTKEKYIDFLKDIL